MRWRELLVEGLNNLIKVAKRRCYGIYKTSIYNNICVLEYELAQECHEITHRSSIKLTIVRFSVQPYLFAFFNIHHIILDGVSLDTFIIDLNGRNRHPALRPH